MERIRQSIDYKGKKNKGKQTLIYFPIICNG